MQFPTISQFIPEFIRNKPLPVELRSPKEGCTHFEDASAQIKTIWEKALEGHVQCSLRFSENPDQRQAISGLLKKLEPHVHISPTNDANVFRIEPIRTKTEYPGGVILTYNNGIVEDRKPQNAPTGWQGTRKYPNGVIETGTFDDDSFFVAGTRTSKNGREEFLLLIPIVSAKGKGLTRNSEGEIIVVKSAGQNPFHYVRTDEPIIPNLSDILRYSALDFQTLSQLLTNRSSLQELVNFLFETNAIFSLNEKSFLAVLQLIQTQEVKVNLRQLHPGTQETLLHRYCHDTNVSKLLLFLDPSLIRVPEIERMESPFVRALFQGNKNAASLLLAAMKEQGIALTPREDFFRKAFKLDEYKKEVPSEESNPLTHLTPEDWARAYQTQG